MTTIRAIHNRSGEFERFEPAPLPDMHEIHATPFNFTGQVAPTLIALIALIALVLLFIAIACIDATTRVPQVAAPLVEILP